MDHPIITPTVGSVQQIMPAEGRVTIRTKEEAWTLPMVGYGVVVRYADWRLDTGRDAWRFEVETDVAPLVLEDGIPVSITEIIAELRGSFATWKVEQPGAVR